ncbi:MAG: hypothetical protein AAB534_02030 [Patescibacteria group bacterium]
MDRFGEVLFSGQVLQSAGNSGFDLLPFATLSILYLGTHYPRFFFAREQGAWWKKGFSFVSETGVAPRWHLVRRKRLFTVPGMQWNSEQVIAQIPDDEQLPPARVLVYTALVYHLRNEERWLENFYAPSSDKVNGRTVCVGYNDGGGLDITLERDHMPGYKFGVVTEKKPIPAAVA